VAFFSLGLIAYYGEGVSKDEIKAFHLIKKAAEMNERDAQCILGTMYRDGIGVEKNYQLAFYWLQQASVYLDTQSINKPKAMYFLSMLLYEGKGTEQNYSLAIKWLEEAIKYEYYPAQLLLANIYYSGEVVEKNLELAFELHNKAKANAKKEQC